MDAMLMMGLAGSSWFLVDAVEGKRPWRIVAWAALMGLIFNIKFFEGFIVLPAALVYIVWRFRDDRRSIVRPLAAAAVVGAIVSFSWIALVDLTPKDDRPIVMNDKSNSELGLALRYNGLERVLPGCRINAAIGEQPLKILCPLAVKAESYWCVYRSAQKVRPHGSVHAKRDIERSTRKPGSYIFIGRTAFGFIDDDKLDVRYAGHERGFSLTDNPSNLRGGL